MIVVSIASLLRVIQIIALSTIAIRINKRYISTANVDITDLKDTHE